MAVRDGGAHPARVNARPHAPAASRWAIASVLLAGLGSLPATAQVRLPGTAPVPAIPVQQIPDEVEERQSDPIRVNTRLVEIDVVVTDSSGPITGLTADDFIIEDNGKRQTIAAFNVRAGEPEPADGLDRNFVTNRLTPRGAEPVGTTVILWDVLNTGVADQAWVRGQVLDYLATLMPGEEMALYRLSKSLSVVQDFTGNMALLRRAVAASQVETSVSLTAPDLTDQAGTVSLELEGETDAETAQLQAMVEELNQTQITAALELEYYYQRERALITLGALRDIARHLEGLRGRKKLIWVSGSFPALTMKQNERLGAQQIESLNVGTQIQKAVEELNQGNVAVYPVDPRGLVAGSDPLGGEGGFLVSGIDTMNLLASGTGGRAFYATNDLQGAIGEVLADFETTYTLGFYPTEALLDGKYHSLSVKVDRRGAGLRYRKGYYASDVVTANKPERQSQLNRVMTDPLNATRVGLQATVEPMPEQPGIMRLTMAIDIGDLAFEHRDGEWLADIAFATRFGQGYPPRGTTETMRIRLTQERYREASEDGLWFTRLLAVGKSGELRIAVQDQTTGASGALKVLLEGPPEPEPVEPVANKSQPEP